MIKALILDLDGTVYSGDHEVPGAGEFIRRMSERGIRSFFVTNRSNRPPQEVTAQLVEHGIPCTPEDVLTSGEATALYLGSGSVYCVGEEGLRKALEDQGLSITENNPDYVVVSFDRGFSYDKLFLACNLIDGGARFIATNPDRKLKTADGLRPGTGAIVAAVEAGSGAEPIIIGKPEKLIFEIALERLGLEKDEVIAVGDNVDTDILAGVRAGIRTVLLLTGISSRADADAATEKPTWIAETYDQLETIIQQNP
ncbi:MAG: HAD-IIA family hydrolase [Lentisphaerae bacterium]|nr:HAD-IIA family hydrolase [Lentisphaerota bacterium]